MTDESPSARALIAAYKACARPSAAAEAQLWATLAAAERAAATRPRRRAPSLAPWLALAAGLLLLLAWQLDLPRLLASGHVLRDMRQQAAYAGPATDPQAASERGEPASERGEQASEVRESDASTGAPVLVPRPSAPRVDEPAAREPKRAPAMNRPAAPRATPEDEQPDAPDPADAGSDRVLAEMALLQEAQAALRGGQPDEALALLARHAEAFARGSMIEERQALRVLALCAAGEVADGTAEGAVFLRAHPRSTYAPRVAASCSKEHEPKDTSTIP